ncbi:hypothetical protein [Marinobacter alkaliphilus]|uniref:TniQ protein n=1 Tax=Marinobacter alkaliphilus TaxID=254719 RepID=A0ABZ3DZR3_9GAMM
MASKKRRLTLDGAAVNQGHALAHPLQSSYASVRRIVVANPLLSQSNCKRLYTRILSCYDFDRLEKLIPIRRFRLEGDIKQCALCAQQLFHPALYSLPALKLCPVHHLPMTERCPDCGQYWNRALLVRNPVCQTCGVPSWEALGRIQQKRRIYKQIQWVNDWLIACESGDQNLCRPTLIDIYQHLLPSKGIERPILRRPDFCDPYYPAFQSQKLGGAPNRRLERLHIRTFTRPLRTRTTRLEFWPPEQRPEVDHRQETVSTYRAPCALLETLLGLALRRILRWQKNLVGRQHRLTWYDLRALRPEQVREGTPPCPLCMAFSFWCNAVTLKLIEPKFAGQPGEHELCRFVHYPRYPSLPQGVYVEATQWKFFRPSTSFERWLFLRSSDIAFSEFVKLSSWIYERSAFEDVHFRQTGYSEEHHFPRSTDPSELLEITQRQNFLQAQFLDQSPLTTAHLSDADIGNVFRCPTARSCDCERIWSVDPVPERLCRKRVRKLINTVRSNTQLIPNQYPWTKEEYLQARSSDDMQVLTGREPYYSEPQFHVRLWRWPDGF